MCGCDGVEGLSWEDDFGAVGEGGEEAEGQAEAVEERGRAAECVGWGEGHAGADEAGVVDEVVVCEHGGFGTPCTAACELEVGDVVGTYYPVEDVENVFGYALCLLDEFFVADEAVAATYQAYGLEVWEDCIEVFVV